MTRVPRVVTMASFPTSQARLIIRYATNLQGILMVMNRKERHSYGDESKRALTLPKKSFINKSRKINYQKYKQTRKNFTNLSNDFIWFTSFIFVLFVPILF